MDGLAQGVAVICWLLLGDDQILKDEGIVACASVYVR